MSFPAVRFARSAIRAKSRAEPNSPVAVNLQKSNLTAERNASRFHREIRTQTFARHVFGSDAENRRLILEDSAGGPLHVYAVKGRRFAYCHSSGLARRDVNLENILITRFPNMKLSHIGACGVVIGSPANA
jgi:serine/threonine protein kinase